jgi:hypothetical protein
VIVEAVIVTVVEEHQDVVVTDPVETVLELVTLEETMVRVSEVMAGEKEEKEKALEESTVLVVE